MLPTFSIPPVGPRQAKIWGDTQLLFAHHDVECHRITFRAGYRCSRHRHKHKWNRFVILEGRLRVVIFQRHERGERDETVVCPGQVTDVPPDVWHQFEGVQDGVALEFYWTTLEAGDIERLNVGGKIGGVE